MNAATSARAMALVGSFSPTRACGIGHVTRSMMREDVVTYLLWPKEQRAHVAPLARLTPFTHALPLWIELL
jgi:hypothetical protein